MKAIVNRREFIGAFVPSFDAFRKAGQLVKWVFYLFCCYLVIRLFAGVTFAGWKALGLLALKFFAPAFAVVWLAAWAYRRVEQQGSARLVAGVQIAGKALTGISLIALGALWHDLWLRKPSEAIIGAVVMGLIMLAKAWENSRGPRSRFARSR